MIKIIKGSDIVETVKLAIKDSGPIDLTGKTISIKYKDTTNTLKTVACTIVGASTNGRFQFTLTDTETDLLNTGVFDFDVYVELGADTKIYKGRNLFQVEDRIRA